MAGTQDAMTPGPPGQPPTYQPPINPRQLPHPVSFDVEYPERLSRLLIFVKLILAIPHFIVLYVLSAVSGLLTFIAWFAILFTGRYPKGLFDFNYGFYRWSANVATYIFLLRDEYPPFALDGGRYAAMLEIPYPERQSRFRLFIRIFSIIPNLIVFYFVSIAWYFTTFISWFAILFTGQYPRGLFNFSVGALRWQQRMSAYLYLLRDEYPPYSINAAARPGNEVVSTIIGVPIVVAYVGLYIAFLTFTLTGSDTVEVRANLTVAGDLADEEPSGKAGSLRVTLLDYDDDAASREIDVRRGYRLVSFDVVAEKDGLLPTFYTPYLFFLDDCLPAASDETADSVRSVEPDGTDFALHVFWRGGEADDTIYFQIPDFVDSPCSLTYFGGTGFLEFEFR